MIYSIYSDFFT